MRPGRGGPGQHRAHRSSQEQDTARGQQRPRATGVQQQSGRGEARGHDEGGEHAVSQAQHPGAARLTGRTGGVDRRVGDAGANADQDAGQQEPDWPDREGRDDGGQAEQCQARRKRRARMAVGQ
jgi:hypothetical protein